MEIIGEPEFTTLYSFSLEELKEIENKLVASGVDVSGFIDKMVTRAADDNDFVSIEAIKVSVRTPNPGYPEYPDEYITISGVVIVPKYLLFPPTVRLMVSPPPTYVVNASAPSIIFQDPDLVNNDYYAQLYQFWMVQVSTLDYAVLFPDYPGFGDSFEDCFIPYVVREEMIQSTYDLLQATKLTLSAAGYPYKQEIGVSGYSQGGFVATAFVEAMETDLSYGEEVNLLFSGGTPANLKYIADAGRYADSLPLPYLYPYVMCGFKANGYNDIDLAAILQEPYASEAFDKLNGINPDPASDFPTDPKQLFTDNYRLNLDIDPNLAFLNTILADNSIPNWKNKCKMVMVHGTSDIAVYYQNAKDFADKQNEIGGDVTFIPAPGMSHQEAIVEYILALPPYLLIYN